MSFKNTTLQCPCCKKIFATEYYHGGSIEHENSHYNRNVFIHRFDSDYNRDDLFLWAINLDGNHCNIKDNTIDVGREIFNCTLIWLLRNERNDMHDWLKNKEHEIADRYNSVRHIVINELKNQIKKEEMKLEI